MTTSQILVAHAEPQASESLLQILTDCQFMPLTARSVSEAQQILSTQPVILSFCEHSLPVGGYGELLQWEREKGVSIPLIVSSRSVDESEYMEAMARGAFDYIAPPYRRSEIELILRRRREPRLDVKLPAQVYGTDADGLPFLQFVNTCNVSTQGAKICGLTHRLEAGAVIGIRCHEREGYFRVAWVHSDADRYEIGVHNLAPSNKIWDLPDSLT